jgi:Na+-translocating ferredoxin:NAD+ oxidoreductase subunit C
MKPSRTYRHGGIRVDGGGDWEQKGPVENAFLPNGAIILLKQHAGQQARCVVRRGEYVREGMVIGRADGPFSANVHSSIPGIVRDIRVTTLPEGGHAEAVVVALEGSFDRLGRKGERYLWKSMGRNEILATLRDRGVVDTEIPGFPLFDLLGELRDIDLLVINAVESEPYLRAESCLLRDRGAEVMEGVAILNKILSPKRIVIAAGSHDGIPVQAPPSDESLPVEFIPLDPKYPQDMPAQLLEAITGSRASDISRTRKAKGTTILRPSTAFAIYEAVMLAKPMVERYVSIGGGALKRPRVLKARIGTPIGDLIEECGGFLGPPARLVLRSSLRGHSVHDLDTPITKTSSAVIALDAEEVGSLRRTPCIRCGRCAEICPERLDPDTIFRLVERGMLGRALDLGLRSCTVCGACGYICPSRVPLVAAFSSELRALSDERRELVGGLR